MGGHYEYAIDTAAGALRATARAAVDEGAAVDVSFDPGDCVALPP
jgi:hypothetical protein